MAVCAVAAEPLTLGYVELAKDPRYDDRLAYGRPLTAPWGRPYAGAETALRESRFAAAALGLEFRLQRISVPEAAQLGDRLRQAGDEGIRVFLLDLPGDSVATAATLLAGESVLLLNVSAADDRLRGPDCAPNLFHVVPSDAMTADALAQFLITRKWRDLLVLVGPEEADRRMQAALRRAAKRFGLRLVAERPFSLGSDPRERERNNPALLTAGEKYDVVYVIDSRGEFARALPYATLSPRPVVGSAGLAGRAWHWAWERHGAPQLNSRFEKRAGRRMGDWDWAAWMAVKAVVEAAIRGAGTQVAELRQGLVSDALVLDGFKGNRLNFRPWNRQLRQPMLLASDNWVVDRAPMAGFLHPDNTMDTLGLDPRESGCPA